MTEIACPGWRASWLNAWLAAVGVTVLDGRIRLRWSAGAEPTAVLSSEGRDPASVLAEAWPDARLLRDLPIARSWGATPSLARAVPVEVFIARARSARAHPRAWALSSTMTDLEVDGDGMVGHAPFDPPAPKGLTLHERLTTVHGRVEAPPERIRESMEGELARVQGNGLGFDHTRLGSLGDRTDPWVDPVVEVLAFFGLSLLPARGDGIERPRRSARTRVRQRGSLAAAPREPRAFHWPAWRQPLGADAVDALLDAWHPARPRVWDLLGVHAGWRTVPYVRRGDSDTTRAFASERL